MQESHKDELELVYADGADVARLRQGANNAPRGKRGASACAGFVAAALLLVFSLLVTGCASSGSDASKDQSQDAETSVSAEDAEFHVPELGNGWEPIDSMKLEYATQFTVDYYDGGYKLACLSDGARYLFVPKGKKAPEGIDSDIVIIQQPVSDIYLVASDTMCLIEALDAMDAVTVSGISKENWYVESARKAMDSGKIAYGGKYSAPDYDLLLSKKVRLAIESTMINHTPDVRDKLIELGIPVLIEQSSYETDPLGRCEWVKFYGAMFDKEKEAEELFDKQIEAIKDVTGEKTGKTVMFFYINSNGAAVIRKPGDYVTQMIAMAGGDYIAPEDTGDNEKSGMSNVTLEMESFYAMAHEADVIIYNATIDASVKNKDDLVGKNALLGDFKAVQEGNVWITEQNMYQQMMNTGDIISDFHKVINGSDEGLVYLHKME